jgi:hypothetical protein
MKLDKFTQAYVETALWSSCDDNDRPLDENYDISDIDADSLNKMIEDCKAFQETNAEWLTDEHCLHAGEPLPRAGHDFWLTRNGHGAGFWDGDWSYKADQAMTKCSKAYGSVDLCVGDDGKIYC